MVVNRFRSVLVGILVVVVGGWIGHRSYRYVSHVTPPSISLRGLEADRHHRGVAVCTLAGESEYKISTVDVFLDGKQLTLHGAGHIGGCRFERSFEIDTYNLTNGSHTLEVKAADASYNRNAAVLKNEFQVDNTSLKAAFLQQDFGIDQGRTIHVQIQTNKTLHAAHITFMGKKHQCYPESDHSTVYECFIPTDCEDKPNEYLLKASLEDETRSSVELSEKVSVRYFPFARAKGFSIASSKLEEEKKVSESDKALKTVLETHLAQSSQEKLWSGPFILPMEVQRVTTPFGEIRTTPEKGRYHHAAVDLVNSPKCVVWAAQDGRVIVKQRYLHSGNTVVLDHGRGVMSLYYHLDGYGDIEVGDVIKKGNPIGREGKTGYASGYHLHWELRVGNQPVDPYQWTEKTF